MGPSQSIRWKGPLTNNCHSKTDFSQGLSFPRLFYSTSLQLSEEETHARVKESVVSLSTALSRNLVDMKQNGNKSSLVKCDLHLWLGYNQQSQLELRVIFFNDTIIL